MKRGGGLRRTVGLARGPALVRKSALKPASPSREARSAPAGAPKSGDWSEDTRQAVAARSRGECEVRIPGVCTGAATDYYHRQARRSRRHDAANCLHACRKCHGRVHAQPALAMHMGWIVSQYADPSTAPVNFGGDWWLLLENGGRERTGAPL